MQKTINPFHIMFLVQISQLLLSGTMSSDLIRLIVERVQFMIGRLIGNYSVEEFNHQLLTVKCATQEVQFHIWQSSRHVPTRRFLFFAPDVLLALLHGVTVFCVLVFVDPTNKICCLLHCILRWVCLQSAGLHQTQLLSPSQIFPSEKTIKQTF